MSDYNNYSNYHAWKEVDDWLAWQYTIPSGQRLTHESVLFLTGNAGIGKTFLVESLCKRRDIDIVMIHSHNCENSKELRDRIFKACTTRLVDNIQGRQAAQRLILLDELDTLLNMDRMVLSVLADILGTGLPRVPIIAIGSSQSEKKLAIFKTKCVHVTMFPVNIADIFLFLKNCVKERGEAKGTARPNAAQLMEIAESSNGSLSFAKQQLEMAGGGEREGDNDRTRIGASNTSKTGGMDSSLTCFRYIYGDNELHHIVQLLTEDPWLNPLRFHENLIKEIASRKGTNAEKARVYASLLKIITEWDAFMSSGEDVIAIEHLARGIQTHLRLLTTKKSTTKKASTANDKKMQGAAEQDLQGFTKLFSQMSIQKKHERTLYNGSSFPWHDAQIFFHEYK